MDIEKEFDFRAHGKLGEVVHARFEERLVEVAGDVLADVGAAAFGVAHFAEDSAARASDAFDGMDGAVGVEGGVHGRFAFEVCVLGADLSGGGEFLDVFVAGVEFSFAVGEGDVVEVAHFGAGEPGGEAGADAGGGVAGDVAADVVVD